MIHYSRCPFCESEAIEKQLDVKDYTVSGEVFPVWFCNNCKSAFTNDVPSLQEIGNYYKSENYISHSNTSRGLINKLYHSVRNITLQSKARLLKKYLQKRTGSVLDIGSGTGMFLKTMKAQGWNVTGIEPDEGARKISSEQNGITVNMPAYLYSLPPQSFDAITLWHVLEHVHDLHNYLDQIKVLTAPTGKIFIAVPNFTSGDANRYKSHWAAYDVPRHLYHFSPAGMHTLMQRHGIRIVKMHPMWFDSFYVSMLSEQYRRGKTNYPSALWNGMLSNFKALGNVSKCSSVIYVCEKIS